MIIKEIAEHRSIRKFKPQPIEAEVLHEVLTAATRASTCGNMQTYSLIVTKDKMLREQLAPCHFNQPAATSAPAIITVCADIHRFSKWCRMRGAEPQYDNFLWYVNASIDALLAAQNLMTEAQAHGLGICVLGTTLYTADKIIEILKLPKGVIPVTAISIGYPDEQPPLTDRLPVEAVVHSEVYHDPTDVEIDQFWAKKEGEELTKKLIVENNLPNLARIFTDNRYKAEDNLAFSRKYLEVLQKQGFLNQ